jgi:hypothetical protein
VGFRSGRDMERIEQAVSAALAIEAPGIEWDRSGARPKVTINILAVAQRLSG